MSDAPYEKNIQVPALKGQLQPLRFPDLESAKSALFDELSLFHLYYDENPDAKHINPLFGELDKAQWLQLHFKHSHHHFTQFGLL
jgi:oxepin-CoA hydrolase/3-oxo-5,6-dehydrosuberyl-CoA semialdehyde dehydrogenase